MTRLCALILFLALTTSCSSSETSAPPPSSAPGTSPAVTPTSTPSKAVGVNVTKAQLVAADPCGFVDPRALAAYGKVAAEPQTSFDGCYFSVTGTPVTSLGGGLQLGTQLSGADPGDRTYFQREIDGVQVFGYWLTRDKLCTREIAALDGAVIKITASFNQAPVTDPCAASDAITRSVVRALAEGRVKAAPWPKSSLARRDACKLLAAKEAARVPGSDRTVNPGFGSHHCTWGGEDVRLASAYVALNREEPPAGGRPVMIQGRRVLLESSPRNELAQLMGPSLPSCSAKVNYQPLRPAYKNWVETLTVTVSVDNDDEIVLCALAEDFVRGALGRL